MTPPPPPPPPLSLSLQLGLILPNLEPQPEAVCISSDRDPQMFPGPPAVQQQPGMAKEVSLLLSTSPSISVSPGLRGAERSLRRRSFRCGG